MISTSFNDFGQTETKADGALRALMQRFPGSVGAMLPETIQREFYDVLTVKQVYGPRLWDTPGVLALQVGLSEQGRPLLDVIVQKPGDIPRVPKFLNVPSPEGGIVKIRARAVGFALNLPKQKLAAAQTKLDQMLFNLQGYRTAGIAYAKDGTPILAAVLLSKLDTGNVPTQIDGFPVRVFYLA